MNELTHKEKGRILLGVMTAIFLAAIESTGVSTAMPTVIATLGGLEIYSWVFTVYLLTFTVTMPLWGKLSDLFGRRPMYLLGIGVFLLGSILSGLAQSMGQLIAFRAIQGLGGGALYPLGMTVAADLYPLEQRARVQGAFSGMWGIASFMGPLMGGLFADHLSWRWIFYVNVPFGLVAMGIIASSLKEPRGVRRQVSVDYAGGVVFTLAVTILLLAFLGAGGEKGWGEWSVLGAVLLSGALLGLFLWIERRASEPIIPLGLFRNRIFLAAALTGLLSGMAMFGSMAYIPLFMQGVLGASATVAGSVLTPFVLCWVIFSTLSARWALKVGYRTTVLTGMVFLVGGFSLLARMDVGTSYVMVMTAMLLAGAGMGMVMVPMLLAVQHAVARRYLGAATSATQFFRSIGGALGVALMGTIMAKRLRTEFGALLQSATTSMSTEQLHALVRHPDVVVDPVARRGLPASVLLVLRDALGSSLHLVFLAGLLIAIVALLSAFLVPGGTAQELAVGHEEPGSFR